MVKCQYDLLCRYNDTHCVPHFDQVTFIFIYY